MQRQFDFRFRNPLDAIKLFGLNGLSIEAEIRRVETEFDVDFGHRRSDSREDQHFYPQFPLKLRAHAEANPTASGSARLVSSNELVFTRVLRG